MNKKDSVTVQTMNTKGKIIKDKCVCTVDGENIDDCVLDYDSPDFCSIARKKEYTKKSECPYWKEV